MTQSIPSIPSIPPIQPIRSLIRRAAGLVLLLAVAAAGPLAAQAAPSTPQPGRPEFPTFTFQILLLVAELEGPAKLEGIPANAEKALRDLQDFLPYKGYRLLDVAFLRTARSARAALSGPAGQSYDVSFVVRSAPESGPDRLFFESFAVREQPFTPLERAVETPGARVEVRAPRAASEILSTSFGLAIGETIVVGTSKLDGPSKALVVLLSAVP
jgi:hypothetical protein